MHYSKTPESRFTDLFKICIQSFDNTIIHGCRKIVHRGGGEFFKKFLGKVGASRVFDSTISITEFVNQCKICFSVSVLHFDQLRSQKF